MAQQVFINLPVVDLQRSKAFYTALGFSINPQFSDENGACVVISDTIYVMLLTPEFFRRFTTKEIANAHQTTEVLNCLSTETKAGVQDLLEKAARSGGQVTRPAKEELGMYGGAFEDPDGHIWELVWMNMSAHTASEAMQPEATAS